MVKSILVFESLLVLIDGQLTFDASDLAYPRHEFIYSEPRCPDGVVQLAKMRLTRRVAR